MLHKLKILFILACLSLIPDAGQKLYAQNCANDSSGFTPITDLGNGTYQGYEGGLYFGSNAKPAQHSTHLINAISNISPLDTSGSPDSTDGKVVLLAIGASNPNTEFQSFQNMADTFSLINPYLEIVNGCKGGNGLQKIKDSTDNYWQFVSGQLDTNGVSNAQVQLIWLEEENTQINNMNFPSAPQALMEEFKELFEVLLHYYPNAQICYLTARGYSGYVDTASAAGNGLRHPRDYYNGWAMKWLIENQISGDTTLSFSGQNRKVPLLDWSAYLWANGNNPRNDGLTWICPDDVKPNDGLHWSQAGNDKAGNLIFERFLLDNEARLWFLGNTTTSAAGQPDISGFHVYPNLSDGQITVHSKSDEYTIELINIASGEIIEKFTAHRNYTFSHRARGIYLLRISCENSQYIRKIVIM